jgi:hypothetical protein
MGFLWLSEWTAIISLSSINQLFVMETRVFFEVGIECLNMYELRASKG